MLRRHLKNQRTIRQHASEMERRQRLLDETRTAIREIYNRVYHKEIFPDICRAEGLTNLQLMMLDEAIRDSDMASRDDFHYKYNKLVAIKLRDIKDINTKNQTEIRRLKDRFQTIMAQFEHLQE